MVVPVYNSGSYSYDPVPSIESDLNAFNTVDPRQRNLEDIEIAVKNIERFILSDNSFPELGDKLKVRQGNASFFFFDVS